MENQPPLQDGYEENIAPIIDLLDKRLKRSYGAALMKHIDNRAGQPAGENYAHESADEGSDE